jgi:hypothetical protein
LKTNAVHFCFLSKRTPKCDSLKRCFKSGIINPNGKMKRALKQQRSKVCTNRYRRRVFATNIFSAMQMCARQSMNQIATSK